MDRWIGKVAVVTGASSGIGLHLAKTLVENGLIVVGLARRKTLMEEKMQNLEGKGSFRAIECDVTREESVIQAFDAIQKDYGNVHLLVNNAGLMSKGPMAAIEIAKLQETINVNLLGLLYCTRQAVRSMKENDCEGHIVNIGSGLGHKVLFIEGFDMNVYPATKFAVRALSESLQNELRGTQIRVTHISPGVVRTEFIEAAGLDPAFLDISPCLNAEDVTDAVLYAVSRKPHVQIAEIILRNVHDLLR